MLAQKSLLQRLPKQHAPKRIPTPTLPIKQASKKRLPGSFRPVRRQQREEQDTRPSWCFEDRDIY